MINKTTKSIINTIFEIVDIRNQYDEMNDTIKDFIQDDRGVLSYADERLMDSVIDTFDTYLLELTGIEDIASGFLWEGAHSFHHGEKEYILSNKEDFIEFINIVEENNKKEKK